MYIRKCFTDKELETKLPVSSWLNDSDIIVLFDSINSVKKNATCRTKSEAKNPLIVVELYDQEPV